MFLISSCSWFLGVKKLGDNIYWDEIILHTKEDKYNGIGTCMIPSEIIEVKKDNRFIIVKSIDLKNQINYWLIDKAMNCHQLYLIESDSFNSGYYKFSNVYGPYDSLDFVALKQRKGVKLE
jgi:hypothetical protein